MGNRKIKKLIPFLLAVTILIGFAVFSDTSICLFKRFTGLPCPSCGMTRSYLSLFSGDIENAFFMHPLFWMIPIIAGLVIFSYYKKVNFTKIYILIMVLFIVVYIIRMILYFPDTYPFNYEYSSIIGRLLFH